jgi:GntR family transcriptional regulator/MocR family aminotransferase
VSASALRSVAVARGAAGQGGRTAGWNGFLLGYSQVPAEQADGLVRKLAALVRASSLAK